MANFRSLSSRLTAQFAALFAGAMLVIFVILSALISGSASRRVESELNASGAVYDRLWAQRSRELQGVAELLARDFGFRSAVATGDAPTMQSALANATARLHVDTAFIVTERGQALSLLGPLPSGQSHALWSPLDAGNYSGVGVIDGKLRQIVAAPILAPNLIGWVVFAADLDDREMRGLEKLSAIPLRAAILDRNGGRWIQSAGGMRALGEGSAALAEQHAASRAAFDAEVDGLDSIVLAKPLPSFFENGRAVLLLAYPRSAALHDARRLQLALLFVTIAGLALVAMGTWRAAGRITRPLARLDHAAGRLALGENIRVDVRGEDELARLAGSFNDMVGKIAERERRITELAFNDPLTGLPNRAMIKQQLDNAFRGMRASNSSFAVHCLDLDQFRAVNDTLGHPAGDALLVESGRRLLAAANGHFVGRLGGDEFVVLQTIGADREAVGVLANAMLDALSRPFAVGGKDLAPSTSIGIAIAPGDGGDGETLLRNAELALSRAKALGRNALAFFEQHLNERAQYRRNLEVGLRRALERDEFDLVFQPIVSLSEDRICAFETLLRWSRGERGPVSPAEFIPIAEECGLIDPIGRMVLDRAAAIACDWPEHVRVAVNVSPIQFRRGDLVGAVQGALQRTGLAPGRLELEITETVFLGDSQSVMQQMHALRDLGVRIALDDFGTGYSSLSYLQSFPFDKLKIDQSFVRALLTRDGSGAIIEAVTALARALSIETTAEGVEKDVQMEMLRAHGCTSVQGYLFGAPMSDAEVRQLFDGGSATLRHVA